MYLKVLFIISSVITNGFSTEMNSCTDSKGIYPNVSYYINSYVCDSSPCSCIPNCPATISVDFVAPRYLETLKPKATFSFGGIEKDYDLGQNDACEGFTNTQCPVVKDEKINYVHELNIPPWIPEVTVTLRFSIVDEDLDEDVVCFTWDITITITNCPP